MQASNMKVLVTGGSGFIGRYLCSLLTDNGYEVLNLDNKEPDVGSAGTWINCSILDEAELVSTFIEIQPDYVFHLAAKADVFGEVLEDYNVNIVGTENVLKACKSIPALKHLIVTSSQLVVKPNYVPTSDDDYSPLDELYSLSKVKTETLTRNGKLPFSWTIVRPTNIWGARHPRFPTQIWKYITKRWYFHPSDDVIRSYGYVENVVYQMTRIIEVDTDLVHKKVFYVGDKPTFSLDWVDGFSRELIGKGVRRFPSLILKYSAIFGELLKKIGLPSPIYMDRYKSMTSEYVVPMDKTFDILGTGPYSLAEGIKKTVKWIKEENNE
ncbi:MAG: NAD(P)-dependent oxidoreductase [Colwellia sp.]|nr:NAD(P)-dependent oxidoreductase [Colwellia sp.]